MVNDNRLACVVALLNAKEKELARLRQALEYIADKYDSDFDGTSEVSRLASEALEG